MDLHSYLHYYDMLKKKLLVFCFLLIKENLTAQTNLLYMAEFTKASFFPELELNKVQHEFTSNGLKITGKSGVVQLKKAYSLGERLVKYQLLFAKDTKAVFQSSSGDLKLLIDVPQQMMQLQTSPIAGKKIDINDRDEYLLEIRRNYQQTTITLSNFSSGESTVLEINGDGSGGVGTGAIREERFIVHHWDHYCFGLLDGSALLVKQMVVQSLESDLTLLIYGDSQSQPEGYFPAKDFHLSWTQLVMQQVKGKSISSGRGGATIKDLKERINNELPYLKARYVMVTIGTNGGNTEENLSQLVEYIMAQHSIPILNNIASNESGTQVEINRIIDKVRIKYGIKGVRFDIATSISGDGKEVDKSTMWLEDYTAVNGWGHIYHHPNVKGSRKMYLQTLLDVPEIYE